MNSQLKIGDKVEYETEPNPTTKETELIPGTVAQFLPGGRVKLKTDSGEELVVLEEHCEAVYSCYECQDTGYIPVTGGEVVDGVWVPAKKKCPCQNT